MKIPGPDHPIAVTPNPRRVRVASGGRTVADTRSALALKEASHPVVNYIPRRDVDMARLRRTAHATHCPYKGDASYFNIEIDGKTIENAVWSYETPFPAMHAIRDYLAFFPDKVTIEEQSA